MSARLELHPVPEPLPKQADEPVEPRRSYGRTAVVLGVALGLVVLGWVLTEVEHGRVVRSMELQVQALQTELAQKDRTLSAHQQRLDEVRDRVQSLQELLETPVRPSR